MDVLEHVMSTSLDRRDDTLRARVPLARYAEVLAHVAFFGAERTADVVERFGYSLDTWREVDRAWTDGLASGTLVKEPAQIFSFSALFHQHRARLLEDKPTLAALVVDQDKPLRPPPPAATTSPAKPSGVPSYMLADVAHAGATEVDAGASPWAAYATPHGAPQSGVPNPPPVPPTPLTGRSPTEPLPFVHGVSAEVALQSAVEYAQKVQGTTSPPPAASLGSTKAIGDNDIQAIARRVVPFGGSSVQTDVRSVPDPELTLEQHAALYIELELYPNRKNEVLQRYGLTSSQHARLDAGWDAQLTLNPKLAAAWQQAAEKHRARLLGGNGDS